MNIYERKSNTKRLQKVVYEENPPLYRPIRIFQEGNLAENTPMTRTFNMKKDIAAGKNDPAKTKNFKSCKVSERNLGNLAVQRRILLLKIRSLATSRNKNCKITVKNIIKDQFNEKCNVPKQNNENNTKITTKDSAPNKNCAVIRKSLRNSENKRTLTNTSEQLKNLENVENIEIDIDNKDPVNNESIDSNNAKYFNGQNVMNISKNEKEKSFIFTTFQEDLKNKKNRLLKMINGSKRMSYTVPKANVRFNGKLKDILQSSTSRHKPEGKVGEPDPLNIPIIKQSDNAKLLPNYSIILAKSGEDSVCKDDLDLLQQDLEKLLSTSAVRIRYLLSEIGEIDKNDEIHDRKTHIKTSLKRKRIEEKPKFKDFKVTLPKNNSDKFWASIEPFCASVTKEDVAFLDSVIHEFSKEIDIKIPEIGDHYANTWSEEIINDEQNLGKSNSKKNITTNDVKKNGLHAMVETFSIPQTQRLLAGLLEERVLINHTKNGEHLTKNSKLKGSELSKLKSTSGGQKIGTCLDRRLKKELMEQGILTIEDLTKSMPEDEILSEIKKCQQELTTVNEYNIEELNKLRNVIVNDLHSNEIKEQLEKIDKQVLDLYNKIIVTRRSAQQDEGDEFDTTTFSEHITKEFENQADALLKQQIELNREINGLTDMQMIY